MIRTRGRKIVRDIWSRKVRTILVSFSIFIGVLGVVTLFSTGQILVDQLRSDLREDRLAMVRMLVINNSGAVVDNEAALAALRTFPGLTEVNGRAVYPLSWKLPGDETFSKGFIVAYSEPLDQITLEPPRRISGDYPQPGQNQIAVERRMAARHNLKVGDTLVLRVLSHDDTGAATGEIRQESWTISGIVFQPYAELGGITGPLDGNRAVFATYADAQHIAGFTGLSAVYARFIDFKSAKDASSEFQTAIAQNTPYVPVFTTVEDPAKNAAIGQTRATNNVLLTLAMIALVVSGFLVVNVINSIVVEQKRQIGLMKSLGASRLDNFVMYSGIALVYGVIGVIPGVLLGIPGGYLAAKGLATQNNTVIDRFTVSPTGIVIGIVVGLAVPLLASIVPVFNGTRVRILEAMTDFGISSRYGKGPLARLIDVLPLPLTLRQAVNNVNQKKFRLALTGITLTIAAGAFMGIFAVFASLSGLVDDVFSTFGIQITVRPSENQNFEQMKTQLMASVPGLKAVEPATRLAIQIEGYELPQATAGPPGLFAIGHNVANPDLLNLNLRSGTAWDDDPTRSGVVIAAPIADAIGKESGDKVVISAGGNRAEFEIIGVAKYPFPTVWFRWDELARLGGLTAGAPVPNRYFTTLSVGDYDGSLPDHQVTAVGMDEHTGSFLTFVEGGPFAPGQPELIISQDMAERGGYRVGDRLTVSAAGNTQEFTITGIFTLPPQVANQAGVSPDVAAIFWRDLAGLEGRSLSGDPRPNEFAVIMDNPDATAAQADRSINQINEILLKQGITSEFTNWPEFNDQISGFLVAFQVILYLAAALIAAVGAVGLLTTLSISVFERQKEIGVMRSVGAGSRTVAFQFWVEGLIVGIVSWAVGIPISYALSLGLIQVLNFGDLVQLEYPPVTLLIGLVGMVVIVTVASLLPSLAAARKTVSDILRYQ